MAASTQTDIHPTAIIGSEVELGRGVTVGPYCVLEGLLQVGDDSWLQSHVTLCGPAVIGCRNRFHAHAAIGHRSQDLKYTGEPTHLVIGDDNTFREFTTVNRATAPGAATRVGNHGNFLAYSHIAHDCTVGDHVIFSNNGTLGGHVTVDDHAILGGLSAVHQFCRIGRFAIIGGCSKIVKDVPPFMTVDGNPARVRSINTVGLRRAGIDESAIEALKKAFKLLFRGEQNFTQAVSSVRVSDVAGFQEIDHLINFLMVSERGVIR